MKEFTSMADKRRAWSLTKPLDPSGDLGDRVKFEKTLWDLLDLELDKKGDLPFDDALEELFDRTREAEETVLAMVKRVADEWHENRIKLF